MLSYQHSFHAGNRADLHKHGLLTWLLTHLTAKDKPASLLDVFAGRGFYDLASDAANKTGEAEAGITRVFARAWPEALAPWQEVLKSLNPQGGLRYYAGSPLLAAKLLRPQDKLSFCELHPTEFKKLHDEFKADSRASLHHRHAHEALLALLPPTPRRGLVLIDPSYEVKTEYQQMAELLIKAQQKWPEGCFMLWYPLLQGERHIAMRRLLAAQDIPQVIGEWRWRESWHEDSAELHGKGMMGSGLLVLNPPWRMDKFLGIWHQTLCDWFPGSQASLEVLHAKA